MWTSDRIFSEDLKAIEESSFISWEKFHGKSIFITGVTGLIGYTLACSLLHYEKKHRTGLKVIALVRKLELAKEKFSEQLKDGCNLDFVVGTVEDIPDIFQNIDYIVHCACPTNSTYFVEHPVDTIKTIVFGTEKVLELAKQKAVKGMVFLSSMEVYGQITTRNVLDESDLGQVDIESTRSSYPLGKRMAENLCGCYASQYQVPVSIARLVQTFGPGVSYNDGRVFAYMARCAMQGEDILLKTSGSKENMYLYTADAVSAVLLLLTNGHSGKAYNIANTNTYCSVKEMAELVADAVSQNTINVKTNVGGDSSMYRPEGYLNLSTSKMNDLGWKATTNLQEMFLRMIASF